MSTTGFFKTDKCHVFCSKPAGKMQKRDQPTQDQLGPTNLDAKVWPKPLEMTSGAPGKPRWPDISGRWYYVSKLAARLDVFERQRSKYDQIWSKALNIRFVATENHHVQDESSRMTPFSIAVGFQGATACAGVASWTSPWPACAPLGVKKCLRDPGWTYSSMKNTKHTEKKTFWNLRLLLKLENVAGSRSSKTYFWAGQWDKKNLPKLWSGGGLEWRSSDRIFPVSSLTLATCDIDENLYGCFLKWGIPKMDGL